MSAESMTAENATGWSSLGPPEVAELAPGERHYLLIDAAQVDRFSSQLRALPKGWVPEPVFAQPLALDRFDATPHLLALPDAIDCGAFMRTSLARQMAFPGALSWLVSPLPVQTLAERLRLRLDARLPDEYDCINRFFDGRIAPPLHACLSPQRQHDFFSVCTQWWVVSHDHRWQRLACQFEAQDPFEAPLRLSDAQQAAMVDAAYPYSVIEHFEQSDPELLDAIAPEQRYTQIAQALHRAAAYGIDSGASAVLFCTLVLTLGESFDREPDWAVALERVKRNEITLQQAIKAQHD